jgi:hypothetical protein
MQRLTAEEMQARVAACHPEVQAVLAYWREKARGRKMPARADIDPSELTPFLPRIGLVDVVPDARRFVYRLVGTEDAALRGHDPTGKSIAEGFFGPDAAEALNHYEYTAQYCEPYCHRGPFQAQDGVTEEEDVIFLPLSEDGQSVNMILVFYYSYRFHPRVAYSSVLLRYRQRKQEDL